MIEAFLATYTKGDGSPHNHPASRRYVTPSKQLADDLHEVLCKLGRRSTEFIPRWQRPTTVRPGRRRQEQGRQAPRSCRG